LILSKSIVELSGFVKHILEWIGLDDCLKFVCKRVCEETLVECKVPG
jgi:hypothetical protein